MLQIKFTKKSSVLGAIIFALVTLLSGTFLGSGNKVHAQSAVPPENTPPEIVEIIANPTPGGNLEDLKTELDSLEYESVTLKSEFQIGDQVQTDFLIKKQGEDNTNLEKDLDNERAGYLHNLENAPSTVGDKKEIKKATKEEIRLAIDKIDKEKSEIKEAKFLVKSVNKDKVKTSLEKNKKFEKIIEQEVKKAESKTEPKAEQKADQQTQAPQAPQTKQNDPSLKELQKTTRYWLDKISPSLQVHAQSAVPDWVPDFSSVNFFDMDEVGTWVDSNWTNANIVSNAQPSVAFGNGRMYIAVRGTDNKVYVGNWDSNGGNFLGWNEVGNGWTTPAAPTIEWYYGRLYVGIRGTNNTPYYKYSTNGTGAWTSWTSMGGVVASGIDFERLGNSLYAGGRGTDNRIYLNRMDNGNNVWTGWAQKGSWSTPDKPVLAGHNNTIYFGIRGYDNKAYVNTNAVTWSDTNWKVARGGGVNESFGMASIDSKLCFLFRGANSQLVQGCSDSPSIPTPPYAINSNLYSSYAPALGKDYHLMQVAVGSYNLPPIGNTSTHFRKLGYVQSTLGSRGYISEMVWADGSSGFEVNSTYEQDIFLFNGDNPDQNKTTYITKETTAYIPLPYPPKGCYPIVRYLTSTLPSSYLDTRVQYTANPFELCDNTSNEVSYTIGTSNPTQIVANTRYINYWTAAEGDRNRPVFKLTAQLGEMRPDTCIIRLDCILQISSGNRYTCNVVGDEWCSFSTDQKILTPNDDFKTDLTQTATYPYWYWGYNK
jgi:hypothetical protein